MTTEAATKPDARARKVAEHARLAADAFKDHVCTQVLDQGMYRAWHCAKPDRCEYWFDVVTGPGWLMVRGDVGELIVQRTEDMIAWSRSAINSIGYFAEKVPHEIETKKYDPDVAREWIDEEIAECQREILEASENVDCKIYRRRREALIGLKDSDLDDGPGFIREAYDEGLFDGGDIPSFGNWTSSFLWCRECVKWLLAHIGQEPVK